MRDDRDPMPSQGEPPPWPYYSSAHRTRRLAANLMLFGVALLAGYLVIRWVTGAAAEVIVAVMG